MDATVPLLIVENDALQVKFQFTEYDLRIFCFSTQYYVRDMKSRSGRMTLRQEKVCYEVNQKLDIELVRLGGFHAPAKNLTGTLHLSAEDALLIEDALRFYINLDTTHSDSTLGPALTRFQQETRLLLAILAADEQQ